MDNGLVYEIVLGEKFPFKKYIQPGDFNSAILTASSFDVVISLTDLTEKEEYAIADSAFEVYLIDTVYGPFIVFDFGGNLRFDFSLNILKMEQDSIPGWLHNPDETVHMYLLEGSDSVVKAVRFVHFDKMYELKSSCMRQLEKDKTMVDAFIHNIYSRYSITDLIRHAQYHFTVPETNVSL